MTSFEYDSQDIVTEGMDERGFQDVEMADEDDEMSNFYAQCEATDSSDDNENLFTQDVGMVDEDDKSMDSLDADDDESLFVPGKKLDQHSLLATSIADEDIVLDVPSETALSMEGMTHRSQIDQIEQEQRLYSQASSQAHLQVIDRDKYSKIPKFPAANARRPAQRLSKKNTGAMQRSQKLGKNVHYNIEKFEAAKISMKKKILFDPSVLSLTTNSLDFYLGRYLTQPSRNKARVKIINGKGDKLTVRISNTGFTERGSPLKSFAWTMGSKGSGKQFFQVDPDEVQTLLDRLCYILERLEPIEFFARKGATSRGHFLRCILNRLIRHANPAFKLRAVSDGYYFATWDNGWLQLRNVFYGFNCQPTSIDCYSTEILVRVSTVSLKSLNIPFEDRCRDRESIESYNTPACGPRRSLELQRQLQHIKNSDPDQKAHLDNAQRLSQKLLCTLDGFDGPKPYLKRLATGIKDAHCVTASRGRTLLGLYGDGHVMWYLVKPGNVPQSRLEPSL